MAYNYIRRMYNVDPKIGQRIVMDGKPGTIVRAEGDPAYLNVRFDGQRHASNVHPTWKIDYAPVPDARRMPHDHHKIVLECAPGNEPEALDIALQFLSRPEWHAPVANRKVAGFRRGDTTYSAWGYRFVVRVQQHEKG